MSKAVIRPWGEQKIKNKEVQVTFEVYGGKGQEKD